MKKGIQNPADLMQVYNREASTRAVRKTINSVLSQVFDRRRKIRLSVNQSESEWIYTMNHHGVIATLYIQDMNGKGGGV
jgi:hypothetical protein